MVAGDLIAYLLVTTKMILICACAVFLVSGIDDLFLDICYTVRSVYRRIFILPRFRRLGEDDLLAVPEQPIAVMVPAWDESAVIGPMLANMVRSLNYRNVHIFVGTYPNDPATGEAVDKVQREYPHVHRIVTPHDGPTNKADCMNWIYHGIMSFERQNAMRFQIFSVQDCEDVVHRLCYRLFNFLIPRFDMVQLPVLSLPRKWYEFTGSHYKDEFAQLHFKDMIVREVLSGSIPSAGVGCAFSRRALETIARHHQNAIFNIRSLTEDYELGVTLKSHGLQAVFVKYTASRTVVAKGLFARRSRLRHVNELVCVREYFPSGLRAAMRQKSRWVLGIALQGWANLGWQGGFWTRYMFVRDRKALVTNLVTVLGYFVVLVVLAVWMTIWIDPDAYRYPPLLEQGSLLWYVVIANAALLAERIVVRAYCVYRVYGWQQALLSVPRMPWGNFINFGATCRALRLYARSLLTGKPIAWKRSADSAPPVVWPKQGVLDGERLRCDLLGCIYRAAGRTVAFPRRAIAVLDDCSLADVIVAGASLPDRCPSAIRTIDLRQLRRGGSHALWLDGGNVRIESVNAGRGRRPWVLEPGADEEDD